MDALNLNNMLFALGILVAGLGLVYALSRLATHTFKARFSPHHLLLAQKTILYVGIVLVICTVLIHLKVKLRTLDNLFVRMPNETLIKAEVTKGGI